MDQVSNQSPLCHPPATVVVFLSPNDLSTSAMPSPAPLPCISKLHCRYNHFPDDRAWRSSQTILPEKVLKHSLWIDILTLARLIFSFIKVLDLI
ncbi:hypothetical protein CMV_011142 [Castanea mollissima]|uniref:Uncharacterized protein n=1 Tax=Castanea mollissima TaxID=60419 RepID=A0A8J4VL37_9ROSI|nr:hypothetical protein CMV_011142 [Castanea mollissima]